MNILAPWRERVSPLGNRLLDALPAADYERLRPELTPVTLRVGDVLFDSGAGPDHLYFPCSGLVSLLNDLREGATGEVAVVGIDGCVGIVALLGGGARPSRAVVQIEGRALRIRADAMLREFHRGGPLQDLLLRYIQALMIQMSQVAVCNRHHKVEEQVCRWLLMSLDRVAANDIRMTQGLIGTRLGARRTGITEAANRLRNAGLIDYRRGRISVPDRAALVQSACECYRVVTKETERLLGPISRPGATASFWPDVR